MQWVYFFYAIVVAGRPNLSDELSPATFFNAVGRATNSMLS
jgi:hypothetical protein